MVVNATEKLGKIYTKVNPMSLTGQFWRSWQKHSQKSERQPWSKTEMPEGENGK